MKSPSVSKPIFIHALILGLSYLQIANAGVSLTNLVVTGSADTTLQVSFGLSGESDGTSDIVSTESLLLPLGSPWTWLDEGYIGHTYTFFNQPNSGAFYSVVPHDDTYAVYKGLFYDTNGIQQQSSGSFSLRVSPGLAVDGSLLLGSGNYAFSGLFNSDSNATLFISRPVMPPLTMQLKLGADLVTGTVSSSTWMASLLGDRAVFSNRNPAPFVGIYTFVMPGGNPNSVPGGYSLATISVDIAGTCEIAGSLADGTAFTLTSKVSERGTVPVYIPLYAGGGSLVSWLVFTNGGPSDVTGAVVWFKPPQATAKFYPAGFLVQSTVTGSRYVSPPSGTRVLNFSNGEIVFGGGNLAQPFTNNIVLTANNNVVNLNANPLSISISPSTGGFDGVVTAPGTGMGLPFAGVALQKQNVGFGYFLGQNQSGYVLFGPP